MVAVTKKLFLIKFYMCYRKIKIKMRQIHYIATRPGNDNPNFFISEHSYELNRGEKALLILNQEEMLTRLRNRDNRTTRIYDKKQLCVLVSNIDRDIMVDAKTTLTAFYKVPGMRIKMFNVLMHDLVDLPHTNSVTPFEKKNLLC